MSIYRIPAERLPDRIPPQTLRQMLSAYPFAFVALLNSALLIAEGSFFQLHTIGFYVIATFRILMIAGYSFFTLGEQKRQAHEKEIEMRLRR